jgi:hypothetical protein
MCADGRILYYMLYDEQKAKIAIDEISSSSILEGKRVTQKLDYAALHQEVGVCLHAIITLLLLRNII